MPIGDLMGLGAQRGDRAVLEALGIEPDDTAPSDDELADQVAAGDAAWSTWTDLAPDPDWPFMPVPYVPAWPVVAEPAPRMATGETLAREDAEHRRRATSP